MNIKFSVVQIEGKYGLSYGVRRGTDGDLLPGSVYLYVKGDEEGRLRAQLMAGAYATGFKDAEEQLN